MMDQKTIYNQLNQIDIKKGDLLFVKFDLGEFGLIPGFKRKDYVQLFLDYLGKEGTLVTFAFSEYKISLSNNNLPKFDPNGKSTTGAFANIMLKHPEALRSSHPTNSVVAIGKYAKEITESHTDKSFAFGFFKKIIELKGKLLLVGSPGYPGFLTHLVEAELGFHKNFWFRYFVKTKKADGTLFIKKDPGGCSVKTDRLYTYYIREKALKTGMIGQAYSISMTAKDSYRIDKKTLKRNPQLLKCKNPDCFSCRIGTWGKVWYLPIYFFKKIISKISK